MSRPTEHQRTAAAAEAAVYAESDKINEANDQNQRSNYFLRFVFASASAMSFVVVGITN